MNGSVRRRCARKGRLVDRIQQFVERRQIAPKASLQIQRALLRQFQPTRQRTQAQCFALIAFIQRTHA
jgi:hypothetical protein